MSTVKSHSTQIRLALRESDNQICFPNMCAYCGEPAVGSHKLKEKLSKGTEKTGVQMDIPYCQIHYKVEWIGKWILRGLFLVLWLLTMGLFLDWTSGIFPSLEDRALRYMLSAVIFILSALTGMGITYVLQRVIGLVYPPILDFQITRSASGSSLGVRINALAPVWVDISLFNAEVAEAVKLINSDDQARSAGIDVWMEAAESPPSSAERKSRFNLGRVLMVGGGILAMGTFIFWLALAFIGPSTADLNVENSTSLVCMTGGICVAPAVLVGGILMAAGRSQIKQYRLPEAEDPGQADE